MVASMIGTKIVLWDAATGERLRRLGEPSDWRCGLAFSPDSKTIASEWNNVISLWDVATGERLLIFETFKGPWNAIVGLTFSPDGKMVASTSLDTSIFLWDATTGKRLHKLDKFEDPSDFGSRPTFSPDSKTVAFAWMHTVGLWDVATGERLLIFETFEDNRGIFVGLAFSPDGKMVAATSRDKTILLWDAATGKRLHRLEGPLDWESQPAFSPDSKMIASTWRRTVSLWNVATGKRLYTFASFEGDQDFFASSAFSPDGKMIAAVSQHMILLCDTATKRELLKLEGDWNISTGLTFSSDGKMIAFISEGAVHLWDVEVVDAKAEDEDGRSRLLQSSLSKSDMVSETIPIAPASTPYQPGEEERNFYYFGLPSGPKLVARSSGFKWQRQFQDHHEIRRDLKNIGNHPIVGRYNNDVIKDIINALGDLPWNAIDVLRIGYQLDEPTESPVILWVSVPPDSTTWDECCPRAVKCTEVLRKHNILDVECEVREAAVFDLAGPKLLKLQLQDSCPDERLPFTQTLGQSIARSNLAREGSMGLYLKESNGDRYFGLTCRHCVLDTDDKPYSYTNKSQPAMTIIQPGHMAFKKQDEQCDFDLGVWDRRKDGKGRAEAIQALDDSKRILNDFRSPNDRKIGRVFSSPPRALHSDGWLRDWALIELDVEKFDKDLTNMVYIGEVPQSVRTELGKYLPYFYFKTEGNKSLQLKGYVKEDEWKHPDTTDADGMPCRVVAKTGPITGLTWGKVNEVESVTRADLKVTSLEWCVVGLSKNKQFSQKGDSGSVVFDLEGHICGIMTAGTGLTTSTDITYMTPMAWLLPDITKHVRMPIHIC
jgi:WD40 repeat protein